MSQQPVEIQALQFDVSDRLRKSLQASGVSQQDMVDYLDVSRNTVSRWVNGTGPIKKSMLRLWALKTGVPFTWLESGVITDDSPSPDGERTAEALPITKTIRSSTRNKWDTTGVVELFPALRRTA